MPGRAARVRCRSRSSLVFAALVLASAGCKPASVAPASQSTATAAPVAPSFTLVQHEAASTRAVAAQADAHVKHASSNIRCEVCHPCGGALQIAGNFSYPGGTTTAGSDVVASTAAAPATCDVGCHRPFGAPSHRVGWNAGPQGCTECHAQLVASGVASAHFDPAASTAACLSCHDTTQHTGGTVRLLNGDASDAACVACHSGRGQTIGSDTPPLLVGWTDTARGDFHGGRVGTCRFDKLDAAGQRSTGEGALPCPSLQPQVPNTLRITSRWWYASGTSGPWAWTCDIETVDANLNRIGTVLKGLPCPQGTILNSSCNNPAVATGCYPTTLVTRGFGGTLATPYVRGQGALACRTCHDGHSSANAFLVAAQVNGVAIPPSTIDRAGVGAQRLCNACHQGDRHLVCKSCHKESWVTDGEYSWFEGAVVDPVPDGSPCFACHGHEGILRMKVSSPKYPGGGHPFGIAGQSKAQDACSHCHSGWTPPPLEYDAPVLTQGPFITGVTATTATVTWTTNEPATTYVEYGVGVPGYVAGDNVLATQHAVTITGLAPATTYVWRVRSSDSFRNVRRSTLLAFATPSAQAVPVPDLTPAYAGVRVGTYSTTTNLVWYPVVAPSGTTVEYEVQLASDPDFTFLVNGSMPGPGVPGSTVGDSGWVSGTSTTVSGKAALGYPATITNIPQDDCGEIVPNVYYWRVRARDQQGNVSSWSVPASFGAFAGDPWC